MKDLLRRLFFPPRCAACREIVDWYDTGIGLCPSCRNEWTFERRERCAICTKEVSTCACMPESMQKAKCEGLRKLTYYYPNTRKKVQNRVIYTVKENRARTAFAFLAKEMQPMIEEIVGERFRGDFCIAYLPRTKEAKRKYDVDQAEQLARAFSQATGIELIHALVRVGGVSQKRLLQAQRAKNAQQSYTLKKDVSLAGKHILLVDDIVTTGAGMAVGTKLLRKAGADSVCGLAVASDITNREIL